MSIFQLFFASFTQPKKLTAASQKKWWQVLLYLLFLIIIATIPDVLAIHQEGKDLFREIQAIEQKMPDFSFHDQKITVPQKDTGFIYQTNQFVFTFDPDQKRTVKDIQNDLLGDQIGIAMLSDKFIVIVPDESSYSAILPSKQLTFSYAPFDGVTFSSENHSILNQKIQKGLSIALLIADFMLFIINLLSLLIYLLMTCFIANFYNRGINNHFTFGQTFKIICFCLTFPLILMSIVSCFISVGNIAWIIYPIALVYYIRAVKPTYNLKL